MSTTNQELKNNPEDFMRKKIEKFVLTDGRNKLIHIDNQPLFDKPLVGFADGDDALFNEYKDIIGEFHLTPREIWQQLAPEKDDSQLSVICWILPITKKTRASNRKMERVPSHRWAHTRNCGEQFNDALRKYVVNLLHKTGYHGIAPVISDIFSWKDNTPAGIASTWSERHAQYAAGLGTFGLCDGFITLVGKAMRCGSVITNLKLRSTERKYTDHNENCLFFQDDSCTQCITRCPGGAITTKGHDKDKCLQYQKENIDPESYGVEIAGCGLCQTDVPCETGLP